MLSPTPHQHAGLASKLAEVTGKAPCDLNAWDLKKSLLRAGHQGTGFAGKTPILLENTEFYSSSITQQQPHGAATVPLWGDTLKMAQGKVSAPPGSSIHPFPQGEAHLSPQILAFRLRHPKNSALQGSCWSGNNPSGPVELS